MTKDEVKKHPAYLRLTVQQQLFVDTMIDNGAEKIDAALTAYKCKDRFTAVTMASKCMRNLNITRLLDRYFGENISDRVPTKEELAAAAWERAVNSEDENACHKWFALVARVLNYTDKKDDDHAEIVAESRSKENVEKLTAELAARGLLNASKPTSK